MEKVSDFESFGGKAENDSETLRVPGMTVKGARGRARRIIEDEIERRKNEQKEKYPNIYEKIREDSSVLDGFLESLRKKDVPVSTPEWLQFIKVVEEKTKPENLKDNDQFLNSIRISAKIILIKNKENEAIFHEAFDEYFSMIKKVFENELQKEGEQENMERGQEMSDNQDKEDMENYQKEERDSETEPKMKEQLGIEEVNEDLDLPESSEHEDNEEAHGGKEDQHNDILKKEDLSKVGGGDKKNTNLAERAKASIISEGKNIDDKMIEERKESMYSKDKRLRYERRPDKASMKEVIRSLRKIITEISEVKSKKINIKGSVKNFAKLRLRPVYEKEAEKQPEIVLFIDVGGPVDEWSPLMTELADSMTEGLAKLEIYLFHNNLYGYVWKPNPKDIASSNFAEPNSLIDIKKIVKNRKKVIIYGDGEMSHSEFEYDGWQPRDNEERAEKFEMRGDYCLNFIKKHSDSAVWINPIFKKEWRDRDDSGTMASVKDIIPMHDLTVGGVEDAIKKLMEK